MNMTSDATPGLDGCFVHEAPPGSRRLAWDALSFCVPANWELAVYKFLRKGARRIELEDEYAIRLEAEWVRGRKDLNLERIMQRYERAAKPLTLKADEQHDVAKLPDGWHATHFVFKESGADESGDTIEVIEHDLVTAFYLCPQASIFCFVLLHVLPDDRENPVELIQQLAATFQDHNEDAYVPWQLFDIAFRMPRDFVLEKTQFDIGTKLMIFNWKLRRYFLWYFSCADMFLKDGVSPAEWACSYLNGSRLLKGPVFHPDGKGGIRWQRRRPFFLGHREEIATLCYRYDVGCHLMETENKLLVWVYHHRRPDDLDRLPQELRLNTP